MAEIQTPMAQGDFLRYPFPRLLFYLAKKQFSGVLEINREKQKPVRVYFRDGSATYTDLYMSEDILGRILLERGYINDAAFNKSLEALASGDKRQGQILLEMGALTPQRLIDGLNLQLKRKLYRFFGFHKASFVLLNEDHTYGVDGEDAHVRADPLSLIYHGVRNAFSREQLTPELEKLKNANLQVRSNMDKALNRYGFNTDENALVTLLARGVVPYDNVLRLSPLSPVETEMLLYVLWVTEALTIISKTEQLRAVSAKTDPPAPPPTIAPPVSAPTSSTPFAATSAPAPEKKRTATATPAPANTAAPAATAAKPAVSSEQSNAQRQKIRDAHAKLEKQTLYEILGVQATATTEQIRATYFQLAKDYHPDRTAGLGIGDVRSLAEELFRRINEAHSTLSDAKRRKEYDERLEHGAADEKDVRAVLEAEFAFQQGTVFFRKKNFKDALLHFQRALLLNADEGEHHAWLAWTQFNDPSNDRQKMLPQIKQGLLRAIELAPNNASCHYYLGEIYVAMQDENRAVTCFNKTLEIQPNHIDAQRQVRLISMREQKKETKSGIFRSVKR